MMTFVALSLGAIEMHHLLTIFLTLSSIFSLAQDQRLDKARIDFYPSFESKSSLTINFKKSTTTFDLEDQEPNKLKISEEEINELQNVVKLLLSMTQAPYDTLTTKNGETVLLDRRLTEDGMTTLIFLNNFQDPAIKFGNSYSKVEKKLLAKFTKLIEARTPHRGYASKLEEYLN